MRDKVTKSVLHMTVLIAVTSFALLLTLGHFSLTDVYASEDDDNENKQISESLESVQPDDSPDVNTETDEEEYLEEEDLPVREYYIEMMWNGNNGMSFGQPNLTSYGAAFDGRLAINQNEITKYETLKSEMKKYQNKNEQLIQELNSLNEKIILLQNENDKLKSDLISREKQKKDSENTIIELRKLIKQISDDNNINETKHSKELQKIKNSFNSN